MWSPRLTEATQVVPSNGPPGRRPLRNEEQAKSTTRASGAQRSVCASGREGWVGIAAEITPKGVSNFGQSLSQPAADSSCCGTQNSLLAYAHRILTTATPFCSLFPPLAALANVPLCTREPLGQGMRIAVTSAPNFGTKFGWRWLRHRRVGPAGLLAMTMDFCHSEERSDVGIRPFSDGRGSGPPYLGHGLRRPNFGTKFGAAVKSSAPTESPISTTQASRRAAKRPRPRGRGMGGNRRKDHPKRGGTAPATTQAALSEAESAERAAGQIQVLPDD